MADVDPHGTFAHHVRHDPKKPKRRNDLQLQLLPMHILTRLEEVGLEWCDTTITISRQ